MHASRSLGTWLASAALMLIVTPGVTAHDFWIELSTFEPKLGEPLRVQLRVGERFVGDPVPRNDARIERFVVAGPAEERAVIGRDGMDPAGLVRLETPGIWFVGYRSKPSSVELSASAFEQYLREEGLERIIDERAARGESGLAGREQFSRSVKAMLRTAGTTSDRGYNRALGMTLEFVLDADPTVPGGPLPVRLLYESQALEGALVVAFRRTPRGDVQEMARVRTDREGRIAIPIGSGAWLIKAVHMQRAQAGSGAEWTSVWTALTFRVP
jgi:uncharacterized GH25 family protein